LRRFEHFVRVTFDDEDTACEIILRSLSGSAIDSRFATSTDGAETNQSRYKVVPILQPMKEVAPTPEINLTTPDGKRFPCAIFAARS
jgi:hypothetical protein